MRVAIFGWSHRVHSVRWATGLQQRGIDVKLISLDGDPVPGVETVNLPRRGRASYLRHAGRAAHEARAFNPDIVHVHYVTGYGLWGLWTGLRPTVVSVWGSDVVEFPSNPLKRFLVRRVLGRADYVTATSEYLKQVAVGLAPECGPRSTVIPFGVDVPGTTEPMPPLPLKLCYAKGHFARYGPDVLLEAFRMVVDAVPGAHLSIAGHGDMTSALRSQVAFLKLGDHVTFTGQIPGAEMLAFLRQHHIMIMPSRREAFGVVAIECSAAARPMVATTVGGIPEAVQDGRTGLLVPPDDPSALAQAVIKLARDADLMKQMGENGYRWVREHYPWSRSLDLMIDLYQRLIDGQTSNTQNTPF